MGGMLCQKELNSFFLEKPILNLWIPVKSFLVKTSQICQKRNKYMGKIFRTFSLSETATGVWERAWHEESCSKYGTVVYLRAFCQNSMTFSIAKLYLTSHFILLTLRKFSSNLGKQISQYTFLQDSKGLLFPLYFKRKISNLSPSLVF